MMVVVFIVVNAMFAMAQAWVLMFFGLLVFFPSCNLVADWKVESYGVMPTTSIPYTPSLLKFVE
jgi:hypothetical protein